MALRLVNYNQKLAVTSLGHDYLNSVVIRLLVFQIFRLFACRIIISNHIQHFTHTHIHTHRFLKMGFSYSGTSKCDFKL